MSSGAILRSVYLAVIMCGLLSPAALGQGGGGGVPIIPISPEAGLPRPWEEGLQVSPYSVVNLFNGNLITIIQLTSCDPVGPPLEFTLYHNSASASGGSGGIPAPLGFSLGPGWTTSYSGNIKDNLDGTVAHFEDDGNEYVFTYAGGVYVPPLGVHDRLVWDDENDKWVLTRPSQWKRVFDAQGRLIEVHDSSGNVLGIERGGDDQVDYVASAAHDEQNGPWHLVQFEYEQGRLSGLSTPGGLETGVYHWSFAYDGSNRLSAIHHPTDQYVTQDYMTQLAYNGANRITAITDRTGATWNYAYYFPGGHFKKVTDPAPGQGQPRAEQLVTYSSHKTNGLWCTTYTDRRGYQWKFYFDDDGNFRGRCDPLNHERFYTYDGEHNLTSFTNELGKTWSAAYTGWNLHTLTTPIAGQTWTLNWVQPYPTERPNSWRLTQVTDPGGHWVQYGYEQNGETDPTLVTSITEQPDGQGNPQAVTTLEYWHDENDANARGQLKKVIDAHADQGQGIPGVEYLYDYDDFGYFNKVSEGFLTGAYPVEYGPYVNDALGRRHTEPLGEKACATFTIKFDANGNPREIKCGCGKNAPSIRLGLPDKDTFQLPVIPGLSGEVRDLQDVNEYDAEGRPLVLDATVSWWDEAHQDTRMNRRKQTLEYDALGRPLRHGIETDEYAWGAYEDISRTVEVLEYDPDGRPLQVLGPDGQASEYTYDELGRLKTIVRDPLDNSTGVEFFYDAAGRLDYAEYLNGAVTVHHYDDANRLLWIEHKDSSAQLLSEIDYTWTNDNLVEDRTETDLTVTPSSVAFVDFTYDGRHRLIREARTVDGTPVYDLSYAYDQLGNRTRTTDNLTEDYTLYVYDTDFDDPNDLYPYATRNNRLLYYKDYDEPGGIAGGDPVPCPMYEPPEPPAPDPVRMVWYTYYQDGTAANITIRDRSDPSTRRDLGLYYNHNGMLWLALWDEWQVDEDGYVEDTYQMIKAQEFRFDGGRQRYLTRPMSVDPQDWLEPLPGAVWTDYVGAMPYGDFDVTAGPTVTERTGYLTGGAVGGVAGLGDGLFAHQDAATGEAFYVHGDLISSSVLTTDDAGSAVNTLAYTAFGELVTGYSALATRYLYAGGFGYESDLIVLEGAAGTAAITLQHVGARWYQPSVGRFLQADPIGLSGGLNVYTYGWNDPVTAADPYGLDRWVTGVLHRYLIVQDPRGGYKRIDFWGEGDVDFWGPGDLAVRNVEAPKGNRILSTPAQDQALIDLIEELANDAPDYNILFFNCYHMTCFLSEYPEAPPPPKPKWMWDVCFASGTPVAVGGTDVRIEDLTEGAVLVSADVPRMATAWGRVSRIRCEWASDFVCIELDTETLRCTPGHPFWVAGRGWVLAGDLCAGDQLLTASFEAIPVLSVRNERSTDTECVYNLSVDGTETYFVGRSRVLVHNKPR